MKRKTIALLAVLLAAVSCDLGYELVDPSEGTDGYYQVERKGMTLRWKVDVSNITVVLKSDASGWMEAGFGASSLMKDANVILVTATSNSSSAEDYFGVSITNCKADTALGGTNNVTLNYGTATNGMEVSFTMPMNSGDSYDTALTEGSVVRMFLAAGSDSSDTASFDTVSYFDTTLE